MQKICQNSGLLAPQKIFVSLLSIKGETIKKLFNALNDQNISVPGIEVLRDEVGWNHSLALQLVALR